MTSVYHRNPNKRPPLAVAGRDAFIIASESDSHAPLFDLSCGAAVTGLGHSCRPVKDAIAEQIRDLAYCHSAQFTAPSIEAAGEMVLDALRVNSRINGESWSPFAGGAVTFFSGGAEAVEAAVKIAMQVQAHAHPKGNQTTIVGRRHSYHGNSMFTLALGDHPRKAALNAAFNVTAHVERIEAFAPDMFGRDRLQGDDLAAHTALALQSLQHTLQLEAINKRRCVVVIETVGGTTLGIAPPTIEYLIGVRKLCNEFEAILIYDEILCANFRTGRLTAWQCYQEHAAYDLAPDIFVMGKGITAGYFPMSAVVVNKEVREVGMADGKVWHTSTNQNHVVGCAALCAAFTEYHKRTARIEQLAAYMADEVVPFLMQCPDIRTVSGIGMLWGVQFDHTKTDLHLAIKHELLRMNYTTYSDGGTVGGRGNMIMFAPPYTATEAQLDAAAKAITYAACSADVQAA